MHDIEYTQGTRKPLKPKQQPGAGYGILIYNKAYVK